MNNKGELVELAKTVEGSRHAPTTEFGIVLAVAPTAHATKLNVHAILNANAQTVLMNGKTDVRDTPKRKRIQVHFANQRFILKGKEGHKFMLEMGENPKSGP